MALADGMLETARAFATLTASLDRFSGQVTKSAQRDAFRIFLTERTNADLMMGVLRESLFARDLWASLNDPWGWTATAWQSLNDPHGWAATLMASIRHGTTRHSLGSQAAFLADMMAAIGRGAGSTGRP